MVRLTVTPAQALRELAAVQHGIFQRAIGHRWIVESPPNVKAQSVCWLYCWAKTGLNSVEAATAAMRAFDAILNVPYDHFDARVDHEWAREARYRSSDIEEELAARLR